MNEEYENFDCIKVIGYSVKFTYQIFGIMYLVSFIVSILVFISGYNLTQDTASNIIGSLIFFAVLAIIITILVCITSIAILSRLMIASKLKRTGAEAEAFIVDECMSSGCDTWARYIEVAFLVNGNKFVLRNVPLWSDRKQRYCVGESVRILYDSVYTVLDCYESYECTNTTLINAVNGYYGKFKTWDTQRELHEKQQKIAAVREKKQKEIEEAYKKKQEKLKTKPQRRRERQPFDCFSNIKKVQYCRLTIRLTWIMFFIMVPGIRAFLFGVEALLHSKKTVGAVAIFIGLIPVTLALVFIADYKRRVRLLTSIANNGKRTNALVVQYDYDSNINHNSVSLKIALFDEDRNIMIMSMQIGNQLDYVYEVGEMIDIIYEGKNAILNCGSSHKCDDDELKNAVDDYYDLYGSWRVYKS